MTQIEFVFDLCMINLFNSYVYRIIDIDELVWSLLG